MTLAQVRILDVWQAVGGGELRGNRGRAFWREGDGYSVSLNLERNTWYDFRDGRGGGVLVLVETALGCGRAEALAWLETHCGLSPRKRASAEERRRYARAKVAAPALAHRLKDFARGLDLTATPCGARLLRDATATSIADRWRELDPERREHLESTGRADREHAETITRVVVALLAMTHEEWRVAA